MKKKVRNLTLDEIRYMCRKMSKCKTETKCCPFYDNECCPLFPEEVLEREVEIDESRTNTIRGISTILQRIKNGK